MANRNICVTVNGRKYYRTVADNQTLLNFIREDLCLTGTKEGCGVGECGACTVLLNGKAVSSCLVLAQSADNGEVVTVEGLAHPDGTLDTLQQAFIDEGAIQCGFCTPGMLMSAKALLMENPHPTEAEVRLHLEGNLCRCTGYAPIVRAIMKAAEKLD